MMKEIYYDLLDILEVQGETLDFTRESSSVTGDEIRIIDSVKCHV